MDKGIRPHVNNKFVELNEVRRRGDMNNTLFRKSVMADAMELFGITLASAATHYNHAFKTVKELNSELVDGLGRAEDKKGGRKPKAKPELVGPVQPLDVRSLTGNEDEMTGHSDETPAEAPQVVITYSVVKAKDGSVVASGLSEADANALVNKAAKAKKAKLEIAA
jgi:hypothetical protein